jgi:thiosulfate/3-mercaptopyruvate sulfurtransferase
MTGAIPERTTEEVGYLLNTRKPKLIDVRPVDAYNGWRLESEPRGGHIEGAKSLPAKWADYIDWIEIVQSKGIETGDSVILYGHDKEETESVARLFLRAGYRDVSVYHRFASQWSADDNLPMHHLPRYKHLVPSEWLKTLIETSTAPEFESYKYVICHAHYQNPGIYKEAHIPGALALDTNSLESQETWNRRSPEEIEQVLTNLGITYDTTVILYGRFAFPDNKDPFPGSSAGHLAAMRCAFIMMYAGVKDVRVLNGGFQSWTDAGYATTTEDAKASPVSDFGVEIPSHPELALDTPEAKEILRAADRNLVSVRSWREFIGVVSGYNYIEKKGRIPGAVFGNCGSDAYHMENYRNLDHTTREYHEIEAMLAQVGVTRDKYNAFYCGTGWRGSEAFFNTWLMNWPRVSVYDGGWFEWSNDPGNPIETGIPEGASAFQDVR